MLPPVLVARWRRSIRLRKSELIALKVGDSVLKMSDFILKMSGFVLQMGRVLADGH